MSTSLSPAIVERLRAARPAYTDYRVRVTGFLNSDNTVGEDPTSGLDVGYLWVHNEDGRANARVMVAPAFEAFSHTANLRVMTALNTAGERVALELAADSINAPYSTQFAQSRALGGVTPSQNIQGGRVLPHPDGGLKVLIEALPEAGLLTDDILTFAAGDVPTVADTGRWGIVFIADGALGYALTTAEYSSLLNGRDLSTATAWNAPLPANTYRLGAVSLSYGQTAISYATSTFLDQRRWLATENERLGHWLVDYASTIPAGVTAVIPRGVSIVGDGSLTVDGGIYVI